MTSIHPPVWWNDWLTADRDGADGTRRPEAAGLQRPRAAVVQCVAVANPEGLSNPVNPLREEDVHAHLGNRLLVRILGPPRDPRQSPTFCR